MLPSPTRFLRTLRILHMALCGGVTIFCVVALLLRTNRLVDPALQEFEPVLLLVSGVLVMSGLAASILLFRRRLTDIRAMAGPERKLPAYQSAQVLRWALAEAPAFFVIVLMLLTTSPLFIAFAAAPLVYLIGSRPPASVEQACETMNLSWDERERWERES